MSTAIQSNDGVSRKSFCWAPLALALSLAFGACDPGSELDVADEGDREASAAKAAAALSALDQNIFVCRSQKLLRPSFLPENVSAEEGDMHPLSEPEDSLESSRFGTQMQVRAVKGQKIVIATTPQEMDNAWFNGLKNLIAKDNAIKTVCEIWAPGSDLAQAATERPLASNTFSCDFTAKERGLYTVRVTYKYKNIWGNTKPAEAVKLTKVQITCDPNIYANCPQDMVATPVSDGRGYICVDTFKNVYNPNTARALSMPAAGNFNYWTNLTCQDAINACSQVESAPGVRKHLCSEQEYKAAQGQGTSIGLHMSDASWEWTTKGNGTCSISASYMSTTDRDANLGFRCCLDNNPNAGFTYPAMAPIDPVYPAGTPAAANCQNGEFKGDYAGNVNCYREFNTIASWDTAQNTCRGYGMNLVSIRSENENRWVFGRLTMTGHQQMWLGLKRNSEYEAFSRWVSGEETAGSFQSWYPGEPSGGGENCGAMWANFTSSRSYLNSMWNNLPCGSGAVRYFMCKR